LPPHTPFTTDTAPPDAPSPGVWTGLGTVALYFVLQLAVGLVVGIIAVVVYGVFSGMSGHGARTSMMQWAATPDFKASLTVGVIAVVAALMFWLVHRWWRTQWSRPEPPGFGFVLPQNATWWFVGAVIVAVVFVPLGSMLTSLLAHGHTVHQDVTIMGLDVTPAVRVALAVLVGGVAPLVEEMIFRGVLLSGLMRRLPVAWAVLVSALIFGGAHLPDFGFAWYAIPELVLLGVVLALFRLRAHSLWPAIVIHVTNNLIAAVAGWYMLGTL
jgi:membrane protease YdiL (CAAX protease family)